MLQAAASTLDVDMTETVVLIQRDARTSAISQAANLIAAIEEDWRAVGEMDKVHASRYLADQILNIIP